MKFLKVKN